MEVRVVEGRVATPIADSGSDSGGGGGRRHFFPLSTVVKLSPDFL